MLPGTFSRTRGTGLPSHPPPSGGGVMTLSLDLHLPTWHSTGAGGTQFSADRSYRYRLHRRWDDGPSLMIIELRPSGANEHHDDDASRRAAAFARGFGYG
ncbi:DUF1643 domain-containing protein, partial [Mycobacterium avium]|nr:DUF1643 domain-containing protein [Mycobacterium avium]